MFVSLWSIPLHPRPEVYELGLEPGLYIMKKQHICFIVISELFSQKNWMNKEKNEQQKR